MSRMARHATMSPLTAAVLLLTSCTAESAPEPTKTVTVTATAPAPAGSGTTGDQNDKPRKESSSAPSKEPSTALLSDMTGKSLQAAQDTAQSEGFWLLASEDATGQSRFQILDRNWVVCAQTPAAGEHDVTATVTFHVVKDFETCP